MQRARRWPALLLAGLIGTGLLAAGLWRADAPGPPRPALGQLAGLVVPADTLPCPECARRREVQEPGPRGRVLDRRDTVLVASDWHYIFSLPPGRP